MTRLPTFLAALLVLGASTSSAYEVLPFQWTAGHVPFRLNPSFTDTDLSGSPDEQVQILLCAAGAWHDQSRTTFYFDYLGTTTIDRLNERDGVNVLFFKDGADGGEALATTLFTGDKATGAATSFDIVFYDSTDGTPNRWSGPGEPVSGEFDIQGVATHELGHAVGLDHSSVTGSTMYPAAVGRGLPLRTLHSDDREGAEFLYGIRSESPPAVEIASATPLSGPADGGNEVRIEGVNFTYDSDSKLFIDELEVAGTLWDVLDCGAILVRSMPPHDPGEVAIGIVNTIGTVTLDGAYSYLPSPPVIFSVTPAVGPLEGGLEVTLSGKNFWEGAEVSFGESPLEAATLVDSSTIRGILPPGDAEGPVDVVIRQGEDEFTLADGFTYRTSPLFVRGNANGDGDMDLTDPICILDFLFRGGEPLACQDAADANDDGDIDLSDAIKILMVLYQVADPLPAPYPEPGHDPTPDGLDCASGV